MQRRFSADQMLGAVVLCLKVGVSCTAVAQWFRVTNASLAMWVRNASIDSASFVPPAQCQGTIDERSAKSRLCKENCLLMNEKDFSGGQAAAHLAQKQLASGGCV